MPNQAIRENKDGIGFFRDVLNTGRDFLSRVDLAGDQFNAEFLGSFADLGQRYDRALILGV